jgi:uncharacterized protein YuzE
MQPKLTFKYDREADILYINTRSPYPEQESAEIDEGVIARLNSQTGAIENLEVLFFSTRLLREDLFELPVSADLHLVERTWARGSTGSSASSAESVYRKLWGKRIERIIIC